MSQIPIIRKQEDKTEENLVLRLSIHVLQQGPQVDFFWNETWAAQTNPAWPQQVFLTALQALWAAGLVILGKISVPGMVVKTGPTVN